MEIVAWVIGGMVVGAVSAYWYCAIDIRYWRNISAIREYGIDNLQALYRKSEVARQEAISLAEQAADKYLVAQEANNALRALLAARLCPTPPVPLTEADRQWGIETARGLGYVVDDQVEWRLENIEAILRTLEGEL